MASDYQMLRKGMNSFSDYMRLEDEFRMKKEQAARQAQMDALTMQKTQKEIETGVSSKDPAAVREWQFFSKLPDEERAKYLQMKRADQIMNLGGQLAVRNPMGGVQESYEVTPRTVDMPEFQAMQEGAKERASMNVQLGNAAELERQKAAGRASGEQEGANKKKVAQAGTVIDYLNEAESILPKASGGLPGAVMSAGKGLAGYSDETTQANERLKLISGWMVSNVPRMEGPQSNYDVQVYQKMAADLGNPMKPIGDRLAALNQLRVLQNKYAGTQNFDNTSIPPMDASMLDAQTPALPVPTPPTPNVPQKGDVLDGYMFLGGDPGNEKSWKKVR